MLTRKDIILACMATCSGHTFTPVQLQKFLFVLEKQAFAALGGPHFDFKPYHYGPFDKAVYDELENLDHEGKVETIRDPQMKLRKYRLCQDGEAQGRAVLENLEPKVRDYIHALSNFVRTSSFADLVSSIYKAYPEMQVNSIFRR